MSRSWSVVLLLSLALLIGVVFSGIPGPDESGGLDAVAAPSSVGAGSTSGELDSLRARLNAADAERGALRERVRALEGELRDLRANRPKQPGETSTNRQELGSNSSVIAPARPRGITTEVRQLRELALDSTQSTRDRVHALGRLWRIDLASGRTDSRTPEMADLLLPLLANEADAETRRQLCFHLLGVVEPRHKSYLLDALRSDEEPSVRAQAADTLQDLQGEAEVRAALEWASENDPDAQVRATALEMLGRWGESD